MDKVLLFYNPLSGRGLVKNNMDIIIDKFQRKGYQIVPFRLNNKEETERYIRELNKEEYHCIIAAGGDGTVNSMLNLMLKNNLDIPLGIIPAGTSNDFANYLGLNGTIGDICDLLLNGNIKKIDIGSINGHYFINVVSGGNLTAVAHKVSYYPKSNLGMIAYYLKGLGEIPYIKPFECRIQCDQGFKEEEVLIFLVMNSSIAGGFKLAPNANINDGLFDVILIKNCLVTDLIPLFVQILKGEHISSRYVEHFKSSNLIIDTSSEVGVDTDVDGEEGPKFPLNIKMITEGIRLYIPV